MSKTDKDLPYWVLAERHGLPVHRHLSRRGVPIACDVDAPTGGFDACIWTLPLMRRSNCPSVYAQLTYYGSDKARVRDEVEAPWCTVDPATPSACSMISNDPPLPYRATTSSRCWSLSPRRRMGSSVTPTSTKAL